MNSLNGHVITKINSTTISIEVDTTGIVYPVDANTIKVTIYNESNRVLVPIIFNYIKTVL